MDAEKFKLIRSQLTKSSATLVAVSKTKPAEDIRKLYDLGQRDFGENYVQELVSKQPQLPEDIRWHFIGHLQRNKVKYIAPFVHLIQSVDNEKLLKEINKEAQKNNRIIDVLMEVHVAKEETKFGMDKTEVIHLLKETSNYPNARIRGIMGMATFTDDTIQVEKEFNELHRIFQDSRLQYPNEEFNILSMGMSADYPIALRCGSTMVRIGSLLFGKR